MALLVDNFERFRVVVLELADVYEVRKDEDVSHYVDVLSRAIERKTFNTQNKGGKSKKAAPRADFIKRFLNHYLMTTDFEYPTKVSGMEGKMIDNLIVRLKEANATSELFLNWLFNDFIPENTKFNPPMIKLACSNFIVMKFLVNNKELLEERKRDAHEREVTIDILNRARVIIRGSGDTKIKKALKEWDEGKIVIENLHTMVVEAERNRGTNAK